MLLVFIVTGAAIFVALFFLAFLTGIYAACYSGSAMPMWIPVVYFVVSLILTVGAAFLISQATLIRWNKNSKTSHLDTSVDVENKTINPK